MLAPAKSQPGASSTNAGGWTAAGTTQGRQRASGGNTSRSFASWYPTPAPEPGEGSGTGTSKILPAAFVSCRLRPAHCQPSCRGLPHATPQSQDRRGSASCRGQGWRRAPERRQAVTSRRGRRERDRLATNGSRGPTAADTVPEGD